MPKLVNSKVITSIIYTFDATVKTFFSFMNPYPVSKVGMQLHHESTVNSLTT